MKEKSLSLGQHHCREVSTMQGGELFWSDHAEKKGQPLSPSGSCSSLLNSPGVLLLARPNEGLLALWLLVSRSHETQKPNTS
jgi:hypothetical protein